MPSLAIHRDFLREYASLDKKVQDRVSEVFGKFEQATHTGLHLEKINNSRDDRIRTIRVDQYWRGVVLAPESGDTYTLLTVLPHDPAIEWARRRKASVNGATGRIEIRDVETIDEVLPDLTRIVELAPAPLLAHVKDADLRRLGIDDQMLAFARALTSAVQLDAVRQYLPDAQADVLLALIAGYTPDEVWGELGAAIVGGPIDPDDLDAAVRRSRDRVVLVDGPAELMAVFAHPFAQWRVYLHPLQRNVVDATYSGPARVSGGPGTGKTVVALHRADRLARRGDGTVLLTTFTSTLTDSLAAGVKLLVDDPEVADRIEVITVDKLAHRIVAEQHGRPRMLGTLAERQMWKSLIHRLGASFTEAFLAEEWRQVIVAHGITSAEQYLAAKRTGRGRRLGALQKAQVWQAVDEFRRTLTERELWTYETVVVEAARLLAERTTDKPYRHVIVDEAQDLSPEKWRLLRAAVPAGPDDLFIAGDTHQRIYAHRISLRDVGVNVTGRSAKLRLNYRTTAEILGWSLGLLRGEQIDDLNGDLDTLAGCRSEVHGLPPAVQGLAGRTAELKHVIGTVRGWLDSGVEPAEIGVATRVNKAVDALVDELSAAGVPVRHLGKAGAKGGESAVSIGSMHRMKGLEFRCVAIAEVGEGQVPAVAAITPETEDAAAHVQDLQRERCLLFVACTRAREQLSVSWHGAPSPYLVPLL